MADLFADIDAELPSMESEIILRGRANFSQYHLIAAKQAATAASEIEDKFASTAPSQPERDIHMSQVSTAIMCSVAAIEATINEFIVDNVTRLDKIHLDAGVQSKYKLNNRSLTSRQILNITCVSNKVDIIWSILKNFTLSENAIKQDVRYLCRLRNALTHFTPEWDDALANHADLEKKLKNQFTLSPLSDSGCLFFPYRCLSSSCALWAHKTSYDFILFFKSNI